MDNMEETISKLVDDFFNKENLDYLKTNIQVNVRNSDDKYILELTANSSFAKKKLAKTIDELESTIKEKTGDKFIGIELQFFEVKNQKKTKKLILHPDLDSECTFDNFIVADFNREAYSVSIEIAKNPGTRDYNPLFLFGGFGIGKTHLANAIGHYIYKTHPGKKIYYSTPQDIMNSYVKYTRSSNTISFHEQFKEVDVFILDDLQTFSKNWQKTSDEFFNLFNTLYRNGKQMVFASDQFPKELEGLPDRLKTRLSMGIVVDIQNPDVDTKKIFVKRRIKDKNLIPWFDDAIDFYAKHAPDNIRDIIGNLNRINLYSKIRKLERVGKDDVIDILKNFITIENHEISISNVGEAVAAAYDIKVKDLKSKARHKSISEARHIAMYICKKIVDSSYSEIGLFFNRNHSTVITAFNNIEYKIKEDQELNMMIDKIISRLKRG